MWREIPPTGRVQWFPPTALYPPLPSLAISLLSTPQKACVWRRRRRQEGRTPLDLAGAGEACLLALLHNAPAF